MEFRIEDKPAFNLVGVSKRVPMHEVWMGISP
nr:GyrI-like domain-containing protein [Desulfosporosinus fructosivorans]